MGTAVRPAKTSPGQWDAFADVDVFVDEVLAELEAMARERVRPIRPGPQAPLAGAALEALKIMQHEPARRRKLFQNLRYVRTQLSAGGWKIAETPGPIVRLPPLSEKEAAELKLRLLAAGIYPPFLKYGNTSGAGVFRFVISSEHTRAQLEALARVLKAFND